MNMWDGLTSFQVIYETSKNWTPAAQDQSAIYSPILAEPEVQEYFGLTPEWTEACKAWYELSDQIRKYKDTMNA